MASHQTRPSTEVKRYLQRKLLQLRPIESDAQKIAQYFDDPYGFAIKILGIKPWSRQAEILKAVIAHKRVSVVSGHKTGKSTAYSILAIWFYATRAGARVVITAATDRQVNAIIWREIRRLVRGALVPIPGADDISPIARTGLTDPVTFSEIRGYTAKEKEAIAGISGAWIMYLVDEASGVGAEIFEAIEGNRAGGNAWLCLISNPTKADGEFYDSFHSKSQSTMGPRGYFNIRIDSRESPNVTGECGDHFIPGLATPEWIEEKIQDWGEDSSLFKVRVAGLFVVAEEAKVCPLHLLEESHERYDSTPAVGRLCIGLDPAGSGGHGDESAFVPRRGKKILEAITRRGLSPEGHVAIVLDIIKTHQASDGLLPIVVVDVGGDVGAKVWSAFIQHNERLQNLQLVKVRSSDRAVRASTAKIYHLIRDELWAGMREWLRDGGALPPSTKLDADLHAPEFTMAYNGLLKATSKDDLRKLLGRSPDLGDAACLCVWVPLSLREEEAAYAPPAVDGNAMSPYAAAESIYGGAIGNPYAGR